MADKDTTENKQIREWGRKNGFFVADGGPISKELVEAYKKSNK